MTLRKKSTLVTMILLWVLGVAALLLIGVLLLKEIVSFPVRNAEKEEPSPESQDIAVPGRNKVVRLYFATLDGQALQAETRNIQLPGSIQADIRSTLSELILGPSTNLLRTVPHGTLLNTVYVLQDGTAVLDFNQDLVSRLPGGTTTELLTIYSVVDTVTENFAEVRRVKFLVEGEEIETLATHIDTRDPLPPNLSLIRRM